MSKIDTGLAKGEKAIIIVAHPDDETIWMGGTILMNPETEWTILSVCRASDLDREPKFQKVCALYGAQAIIKDGEDKGRLDFLEAVKEAEGLIDEEIHGRYFDYVFTHGKNGEYGHEGHVVVREAVDNLIRGGIIRPGAVFYFDYERNVEGLEPLMLPGNRTQIKIPLPAEILNEKKRIVAEMYGYPYDGIDVGLCTDPECFSKH
jgi:hypothetical protein